MHENPKNLMDEHVREMHSKFAPHLLNDSAFERGKFRQIVPKEMLTRPPHALSGAVVEKRA